MLYFGRVGILWGLCAKVGSSWGEKVITVFFFFCKKNLVHAISNIESINFFQSYIKLYFSHISVARSSSSSFIKGLFILSLYLEVRP
jgi:hypothetical protein